MAVCINAIALCAQQSTGAIIHQVTVVNHVEREITIETNVPAMRIMNNDTLGIATTQTFKVRCGDYQLQLSADGYNSIVDLLHITPSGKTYFKYTLGYSKDITIITNVPTTRYIDSQMFEATDMASYSIPCDSSYTLSLHAKGYYSQKHVLRITHDSPTEYVYEMKSKHPKKPTEWQQFVMLDYTVGTGSWRSHYYGKVGYSNINSLGFRYGRVKFIGWYVAANVSLQGAHYVPSKELCLQETSKVSLNKLSILGGANIWLCCPVYFYTGIGYGHQNVLLVTEDGKYNRPNSEYDVGNGVAWEFGLQGGYKGATFRLGYALVGNGSYTFNECSIGVGYQFKVK